MSQPPSLTRVSSASAGAETRAPTSAMAADTRQNGALTAPCRSEGNALLLWRKSRDAPDAHLGRRAGAPLRARDGLHYEVKPLRVVRGGANDVGRRLVEGGRRRRGHPRQVDH